MKLLRLCLLVALTGCAHENAAPRSEPSTPVNTAPAPAAMNATRAEQIRTECIQDRRLICGRVLKIVPGGLVIDSGYTDLLRSPLLQSWVVPGNVTVSRNPAVLELNTPGTPCIGLALLTDIPRRPKVKIFDYVVIMGYPGGHYVYTPAPNVKNTIRRFSCGLDTAVRLQLPAEPIHSQADH